MILRVKFRRLTCLLHLAKSQRSTQFWLYLQAQMGMRDSIIYINKSKSSSSLKMKLWMILTNSWMTLKANLLFQTWNSLTKWLTLSRMNSGKEVNKSLNIKRKAWMKMRLQRLPLKSSTKTGSPFGWNSSKRTISENKNSLKLWKQPRPWGKILMPLERNYKKPWRSKRRWERSTRRLGSWMRNLLIRLSSKGTSKMPD